MRKTDTLRGGLIWVPFLLASVADASNVTQFVNTNIPVWAASTNYNVGDVRRTVLTPNSLQSEVIWVCFNSHTSGSTFDLTEAANWNVLAGATMVEAYVTATTFTWNKPIGARSIEVFCISGGGGGGSGHRMATTVDRKGGGGGGAGGRSWMVFNAIFVADAVTVTVGAGGTGGAAQTANSTLGNNGTAGAVSSFGDYLKAFGGGIGLGNSGAGGGGGGGGLLSGGGVGNAGATTTGGTGFTASFGSSGAGGGGGALASVTTAAAGGAGGGTPTYYASTLAGGLGGTTAGVQATQGTFDDASRLSSGAGGGFYITGTAGGTGAAGFKYGAGGGGGGASDNGFNSGAGGNGAPGACTIITTFGSNT